MTAANTRATTPQSLLSATVRFVAAAAVAAVLAAVSLGAVQSSHDAVRTTSARLSHGPTTYATLPRVDIVVRRGAAAPKI